MTRASYQSAPLSPSWGRRRGFPLAPPLLRRATQAAGRLVVDLFSIFPGGARSCFPPFIHSFS